MRTPQGFDAEGARSAARDGSFLRSKKSRAKRAPRRRGLALANQAASTPQKFCEAKAFGEHKNAKHFYPKGENSADFAKAKPSPSCTTKVAKQAFGEHKKRLRFLPIGRARFAWVAFCASKKSRAQASAETFAKQMRVQNSADFAIAKPSERVQSRFWSGSSLLQKGLQ